MSWRGGGRNCRGCGSTRSIDSTLTTVRRSCRTSSEGARSFSSTTSCSGPTFKAGCPSCSMIADAFNGSAVHLANHDVMLWAVSRAPLDKLQAYKKRMGWTFPWSSSHGGDFNFDFCASFTEEQQRQGIEYNFHREPVLRWRAGQEGGGEGAEAAFAAMCGIDVPT